MSQTSDNPPSVDAKELSDERLPLTELESVSLRPPSWRKRGAQLALLALALCVGLMATWSVIVPGKRQAAQPKLTPMPAELVSNLTNATITLNGKKLAGHPPMVVSAHLESDEITVSAPLFRPYTCRFKVLTIDGGDATHCLWTTANGLTQAGAPFLIGVYLTPDDLLPGQKAQIVTSLMQRLSLGQQTTTLPGDAIATTYSAIHSTIISQPATTTLQARATLAQAEPQSPTSRGSYPFSPFCEQLICPFGFGPAAYHSAPTGQVWGLVLNAALHWRFTDETGATVADVTYPPDPLAGFLLPSLQAQVVYDATGWHLAAATGPNDDMPAFLCDTGSTILGQRLSPPNNMGPVTNKGVEGCLISLQVDDSKGLFLWRFGVLLAADDGAHAMLPDLPIASPAAIALVSG